MIGASSSRLRVLWLLVALLVLRAAVPAGWMPQAGEAGGYRVALCSGSGPIELVLGEDGAWHREIPAQPAAHDPCPFALAGAQPLDRPIAAAVEPPSYASAALLARPAQDIPSPPSRRALRPPTRGPPRLA